MVWGLCVVWRLHVVLDSVFDLESTVCSGGSLCGVGFNL